MALLLLVNGFFPALWILFTSLKTEGELTQKPITWLPADPTLQNYAQAFTDQPLLTFLFNSFAVALLSTALTLFIATLAGYALARLNLRFRDLILAAIIAVSTFPLVTLLVPLFEIMRALGLLNTWTALVLTGFAFGLVVMGGVGLTGALPLPEAAVAVSFLVLVNAAQVLARGWRDIGRRELGLMLVGSLPLLAVGYWLLEWLAGGNLLTLQLLLGIVIVVSAFQLLGQGGERPLRSPDASFLVFGALAGLMGGLFSTAGPPVV